MVEILDAMASNSSYSPAHMGELIIELKWLPQLYKDYPI